MKKAVKTKFLIETYEKLIENNDEFEVVTRDRKPVEILTTERRGTRFPIIGLVGQDAQVVRSFRTDGTTSLNPQRNSSDDLFLITYNEYFDETKETTEEKKEIIDFRKNKPFKFEPFEKILIYSHESRAWEIDFFERMEGETYTGIIHWEIPKEDVLPYNENTKRLIGKCRDEEAESNS